MRAQKPLRVGPPDMVDPQDIPGRLTAEEREVILEQFAAANTVQPLLDLIEKRVQRCP